MRKINLAPQLLGLECANVEIPTPYGMIRIVQKIGAQATIQVPEEIEIV